MSPGPARVRIGPAGFSYPDWNGCVYPPHPRRDFDRLRWVARFFDLIELNVSFYRVPPASLATRWVDKVRDRPDFRFTAKLHRSLTHERVLDPQVVREVTAFLRPLVEAERLGTVLAQFPWSFRPTGENLDHLRRLRAAFPSWPLAVEVRHGAWARDGNLQALVSLGLTPVNVDQPRIGDSLAPFEPGFPAETAYVRLHGRNRDAWFDREAGRDARYDYLYGPDELAEWSRRIAAIARTAREVHVVTNNHFRGQAVANALELKARLRQPVPEIPRWLAEAVPSLLERLRAAGTAPRRVDDAEKRAEPDPAARVPGGGTPKAAPDPSQGDLFP